MSAHSAAFQRLIARVQRMPAAAQEETQRAAKRAVETTNRQLMQANVPVRAELVSRGTGYRLGLRQIGPITKRFSGSTPTEVLRRNLRAELAAVARNLKENR